MLILFMNNLYKINRVSISLNLVSITMWKQINSRMNEILSKSIMMQNKKLDLHNFLQGCIGRVKTVVFTCSRSRQLSDK